MNSFERLVLKELVQQQQQRRGGGHEDDEDMREFAEERFLRMADCVQREQAQIRHLLQRRTRTCTRDEEEEDYTAATTTRPKQQQQPAVDYTNWWDVPSSSSTRHRHRPATPSSSSLVLPRYLADTASSRQRRLALPAAPNTRPLAHEAVFPAPLAFASRMGL